MNQSTMLRFLVLILPIISISCQPATELKEAEQWKTIEWTLTSEKAYTNPYTDVEVWAEFRNERGDKLVRPAFWNGGNIWVIRFASPDADSQWSWVSYSNTDDKGLAGKSGQVKSVAYTGTNSLLRHGLFTMTSNKRGVQHADGKPFLVVGDTPWSIPFRATISQVKEYARDRHHKGFNAALLMSLQPDRYAEGPDKRDTVSGFARAFDDLSDGHLNKIRIDYFQYMDSLMQQLIDHEIVPVYQPVFHGFGWKGKTVLGTTALPDEYVRYCKYLVARYGSMPAFWLVGADGTGREPGVLPAGKAIEEWDSYQQPTGIHYNPGDNRMLGWARGDSSKVFHYNKTHQAEPWLDFQWAQSGHDNEHLYYKVEGMYENAPIKGAMNGEPTYEGMNGGKYGLGWWQGEEAWSQLMHGGVMGVVYGAAGLWQWKVTKDEPGWETWTDQPVSWRDALSLEGSTYVGLVSKAFDGYDYNNLEKRWDLADGKPLLAVEGKYYVSYIEQGGSIKIKNLPAGMSYHWFNPKTGEMMSAGKTTAEGQFQPPNENPWVLIIGERVVN